VDADELEVAVAMCLADFANTVLAEQKRVWAEEEEARIIADAALVVAEAADCALYYVPDDTTRFFYGVR